MKFKLILYIFSICFVYTEHMYSQELLDGLAFKNLTGYCEDQNGVKSKCTNIGNAWGNAGFTSSSYLNSSNDGNLKIIVDQTSSRYMVGLGTDNQTNHYRDITYALYVRFNRLYLYENGKYKVTGPFINVGDYLQVVKENGVIKYIHNGKLIYTSSIPVNNDLYVLGSIYEVGSVFPIMIADFPLKEDIYTKSSSNTLPGLVDWNTLNGYIYDNNLKCIVSERSSLPFSLSKNYYTYGQPSEVTIQPELSPLFLQGIKDRENNVTIGFLPYTVGDFTRNNIPIDETVFALAFERTSRGEQKTFVLDRGRIAAELPPFEEDSKYRIRVSGDVFFAELYLGGAYQTFYSAKITLSNNQKVLAYQGSTISESPFLNVTGTGITNGLFNSNTYYSDSNKDLIKSNNGDIIDVIKETEQIRARHKISWTNFVNVKDKSSTSISSNDIRLDNPNQTAFAESVSTFSYSDPVRIDFIYNGGNLDFGVKPFLNDLNNLHSGVSISNGQISIVNPISGAPTSINSGDLVSLNNNGSGSIELSVNGLIFGAAQMPQAMVNLNLQMSSGGFGTVWSYSTSSSAFFQNQTTLGDVQVAQNIAYSNCNTGVGMAIRLPNMTLPPAPDAEVPFEIIDLNTNLSVINDEMVIPPLTTGYFPFNLPIGIYRLHIFYNGQNHVKVFEVTTPIKWYEMSAFSGDVNFDEALYASSAESSIDILSPNGDSYSKAANVTPADIHGSYILPINNMAMGKYIIKILNTDLYLEHTTSGKTFGTVPNPIGYVNTLNPNASALKLRATRINPSQVQLDIIEISSAFSEALIASWTYNWLQSAEIDVRIESDVINGYPFVLNPSHTTVCPEPTPVPLDLPAEAFGYAIMKRRYDGNYYVAKDGELRFQFIEDYFVNNQNIDYKLYDMYSDEVTSSCTYTSPISLGDNRYMLDLTTLCSSLQSNVQYRLEVLNSKGEKRVLRFLYLN